MAIHNIIGKVGEDIANEWLKVHEYEILARNWRWGRNEIDFVCSKNGVVVVVEVKCRSQIPEDITTLLPLKKQRAIVRTAARWLAENKMSAELRFDLLTVDINTKKVDHFPDAIMVYDI